VEAGRSRPRAGVGGMRAVGQAHSADELWPPIQELDGLYRSLRCSRVGKRYCPREAVRVRGFGSARESGTSMFCRRRPAYALRRRMPTGTPPFPVQNPGREGTARWALRVTAPARQRSVLWRTVNEPQAVTPADETAGAVLGRGQHQSLGLRADLDGALRIGRHLKSLITRRRSSAGRPCRGRVGCRISTPEACWQ
jgi:hypothetical protein